MRNNVNIDWQTTDRPTTWDEANCAVLMDIRDELKAINRTLQCSETQMIPKYLQCIALNTTKKEKKTARRRKK